MKTSDRLPEECREEILRLKLAGLFESDEPFLKCPKHGAQVVQSHTAEWHCEDPWRCTFSDREIEKMIGHCIEHSFDLRGDETLIVCLGCGKTWVLGDDGK